MKKHFLLLAISASTLNFISLKGQDNNKPDLGEIHGNFQTDLQVYNPDSTIGAPPVPEKALMNGFANIIYRKGNFTAGVRYESYLNALQGFDQRYKGSGIPYRYASYTIDQLEVTAGSYYEQFGNGLILRSYEERSLGYDNAFDGFRLKYQGIRGATVKAFIGKQRFFFEQGPGIVRGIDGEVQLNEMFPLLDSIKPKIMIGGSFVSKYQKDDDPLYRLPENVAAFAGRAGVNYGKFNLTAEYAYKYNDPSASNGFIYKYGDAALLQASYSQKGLGISLGAIRSDNMNFRSDRSATGNALNLNYIPALTKQHAYNLATIYPYATQANGEYGAQAEVVYSLKKGTALGGEYGTSIILNASGFNSLDTVTKTQFEGYEASYEKFGDKVYFKDINVEVARKFSKSFKLTLFYANQVYNKDVVQGLVGYGTVYSNIAVVDFTVRLNTKNAIRTELQTLQTKQDMGSWVSGLIEYTISPHWFFSVIDQYNYGNHLAEKRLHYITGSVGFIKNSLRFTMGYGRQREGIFCVGGICRNVPASNGLTVTVSSSF